MLVGLALPQDGDGRIIHGSFTKETIVNTPAVTDTFVPITAPVDCKGYKIETTDTAAPFSYDFFYQTHYKADAADISYSVMRNGEFRSQCFKVGQIIGVFKAETGKTIRISFVD